MHTLVAIGCPATTAATTNAQTPAINTTMATPAALTIPNTIIATTVTTALFDFKTTTLAKTRLQRMVGYTQAKLHPVDTHCLTISAGMEAHHFRSTTRP